MANPFAFSAESQGEKKEKEKSSLATNIKNNSDLNYIRKITEER